ncbi:MAG: hypothetical protein ACP6IU_06945 [Candidatus Asgardarchaeia archaeon]
MSKSVVKRISKDADEKVLKLQALFARRGIKLTQGEIISLTIRFAYRKLLEFFDFVTTTKEDGIKQYVKNIIETGPEINCIEDHDKSV